MIACCVLQLGVLLWFAYAVSCAPVYCLVVFCFVACWWFACYLILLLDFLWFAWFRYWLIGFIGCVVITILCFAFGLRLFSLCALVLGFLLEFI